MDKISFIIPSNKNNKESYNHNKESYNHNKESYNHNKETLDILKIPNNSTNVKSNTIVVKNNITNYIKIAPNVYSFNSYNLLENENDIYILYNNACQIKKENKFNAINIFKKCVELINNKVKKEIIYEIFINLALLVSDTNGTIDEVENYYKEALNIFSDRAEPYFYWSIYSNKIRHFEKSYDLLNKALLLSYDEAKIKYPGTQINAYGKYLYDELAVSCYWLKKYDEGKILLEKIIDDPVFSHIKQRLNQNLENINTEIANQN
jgi:tetratricopeptide (TPR) repeat protein